MFKRIWVAVLALTVMVGETRVCKGCSKMKKGGNHNHHISTFISDQVLEVEV